MKNRTTAIIITIVAVLLCLCPGLGFLCFGVTDLIDSNIFDSYYYGLSDSWGIGGFCAGILFIIIAAVVIFLVLRKKKETPLPPPPTDEPIPPAI
jgi:hypothetical protein